MNMLTPMSYGDDYAYSFTMVEPNHMFDMSRPIRTLSDIFLSQWNHWQSFNGRFVPHFFLQLFVGILGKDFFNIINSLVFCCVIKLLLLLSDYRYQVFGILLLLFAFVFFMPSLSEILLWTAGAFNYLWSSCFVLFFLYYLGKFGQENLSIKHFILAPVGLLCGWTNEVLTLPVSLTLSLYLLFNIKTCYKQAAMPYVLFFMIGTFLNIFAPSTFQRAQADGVVDILTGTIGKFKSLIIQIAHLKLFFLFIFSAFFFLWKDKKYLGSFIKTNVWWLILLSFSFIPILLSGMIDARIRYGTELFSLLLLMKLYNPFSSCVGKIILTCIISLFLIPMFYYQFQNYRSWKFCEAQMKTPNILMILTPKDCIPDYWSQYVRKMVFFRGSNYYLPCDKNRKETRSVSAFYGKTGMFFFPKDLYDNIHSSFCPFNQKVNTDNELYCKEIQSNDSCKRISIHIRESSEKEIPFYLIPLKPYIQKYKETTYNIDNFCILEIDGKRYVCTPAMEYRIEKRIQSVDCISEL